jgi:mRNA interferase RelE/StbE
MSEPNLSRILEALDKLSHEPLEGDIKKLQGKEDEFRLRVGNYRILFTIKDEEDYIAVYRIAPRGQAYKE